MDYSRTPKYQWGQRVLAGIDLYNDGSYPERDADELLVERGAEGEVVQVGQHEESGVPVYMVEFPGGAVVGCLEEEITPA
jgi:nitrogen fixation protein NifZ